ncbi:MAG TPA: hypothetical protein VFX10_08260 [Nitrospira sp.]|nr:hypothetical protein [Nitrospira sp.]
MPMGGYNCLDCGNEPLIVVAVKEHEAGMVTCPLYGNSEPQQLLSLFIAHTTKTS